MEKTDAKGSLNINLGWKFHLGDEPRAWQKGLMTGMNCIDLPHGWAVQYPFDRDIPVEPGIYQGINFYRKVFYLGKTER